MLTRAKLVEIKWDEKQEQAEEVLDGKKIEVHFNPQTLKISFANKNAGGDQPGGSTRQYVGSSSSKMSLELLFDTTQSGEDVRKHTADIAFFIQPKDKKSEKSVPPGVRFEWGAFIFRGVVDSMEEILDYFSEQGVPLRATISLSISRQDIEFPPDTSGQSRASGSRRPPGDRPLEQARNGDSVQRLVARNCNSNDWKVIAAANGIDDPLRLQAGALLDVNAGVGVSAGAGIGGGVSAGAGLTAGASAGGAAGFSAGLGGGAGFSAGAGVSAGAGIGGGAGASASAGFGAAAGASASASAGFGASAGVSGEASAGVGAGFGAQAGISAGSGFTAGFSGGAGLSAEAGFNAEASFSAGVDFAEE
jgi:hypothetical protein